MPLNSPTNNFPDADLRGTLYVVATPIGNLQDITLRALEVLESVDIIAAEDTRKTGRLLKHRGIRARLISYHEHNERQRSPLLLENLISGRSVALVSNAGTPAISDPGYRLVQAAINRKIKIVPVPGVSAAITAISAAGLPSDGFVFVGFPARKQGHRNRQLKLLQNLPWTLVFYESPKRIVGLIEEIMSLMGNRPAVLAREMTKRHEEFMRNRLSAVLKTLKERPVIKGECTLLVAGDSGKDTVDADALKDNLTSRLKQKTMSLPEITQIVASETGLPKKQIYAEALKIQKKIRQE
jgi:16S rRNA (cytidine1402-2'-O)-methyltransferase